MDISGQGWRVLSGSCLDRLPELADASIDAVVCDPPYELGFMGKRWDSSGIAFDVRVWAECFRVLKPGGHLLAFGGTRTWHRIAVAIEDAGFDIRDSIAWLYGSGFPKSLDVSKAIDKAAGAEREKIRVDSSEVRNPKATGGGRNGEEGATRPWIEKALEIGYHEKDSDIPATPDAQKWQGWGTALKPAFEPVIVARKPLIGTVAENVLAHGTGALNIDGTRIGSEGGTRDSDFIDGTNSAVNSFNAARGGSSALKKGTTTPIGQGRWPSNVMLDEVTAALVDEQSGVSVSKRALMGTMTTAGSHEGYKRASHEGFESVRGYEDSGGASRFFYIAKASRRDRNEGLDELEEVIFSNREKQDHFATICGRHKKQRAICGCEHVQVTKNFHPTVKPTDLMRQLVRLVTPPGGVVLDPFTGSGSTGKAAILEGFEFIGCELTDDYLPIIEGRLNHAVGMVAELAAEAEVREAETLF